VDLGKSKREKKGKKGKRRTAPFSLSWRDIPDEKEKIQSFPLEHCMWR